MSAAAGSPAYPLTIDFTHHGNRGRFIFHAFKPLDEIYFDSEWLPHEFADFRIELQSTAGSFTQNDMNLFEENLRIWAAMHLEKEGVHYEFDSEKNNLRQLYRFHEQKQLLLPLGFLLSEWKGFDDPNHSSTRSATLFSYEYLKDEGESPDGEDWGSQAMDLNDDYFEDNCDQPEKLYAEYLNMCSGIYNALRSGISNGQGFQHRLDWPNPESRYLTTKDTFNESTYDYLTNTWFAAEQIVCDDPLQAVVISQKYSRNGCHLVVSIKELRFNLVYEKYDEDAASPLSYHIKDEGYRTRHRIYLYRVGTYYIEYDSVQYTDDNGFLSMSFRSRSNELLLTIRLVHPLIEMFAPERIEPVDAGAGANAGAGAGAGAGGSDDSSSDDGAGAGDESPEDFIHVVAGPPQSGPQVRNAVVARAPGASASAGAGAGVGSGLLQTTVLPDIVDEVDDLFDGVSDSSDDDNSSNDGGGAGADGGVHFEAALDNDAILKRKLTAAEAEGAVIELSSDEEE